jgi:hypothetical protein
MGVGAMITGTSTAMSDADGAATVVVVGTTAAALLMACTMAVGLAACAADEADAALEECTSASYATEMPVRRLLAVAVEVTLHPLSNVLVLES